MNIPISLNTEIELNTILNNVPTKELISIIKKRSDKTEILESFSSKELVDYMVYNNLINEDLISILINNKKLNLELILGKVAINHFQKIINNSVNNT